MLVTNEATVQFVLHDAKSPNVRSKFNGTSNSKRTKNWMKQSIISIKLLRINWPKAAQNVPNREKLFKKIFKQTKSEFVVLLYMILYDIYIYMILYAVYIEFLFDGLNLCSDFLTSLEYTVDLD